jgi:hypothetical protein
MKQVEDSLQKPDDEAMYNIALLMRRLCPF